MLTDGDDHALGDAHGWKEALYSIVYMSESISSDCDGRNNGLEIPQLDMAIQTITLSGHLSFQAFSYLLSKTIQLPLEWFITLCIIFCQKVILTDINLTL